MDNKIYKIYKNIDWKLILMYLTLLFFGLLNIYSVSQEKAIKQLTWIFFSILTMVVVFFIDPVSYINLSYIMYLISVFLLLGVLFIGKKINGSRAWYCLGQVNFQPTEFAKIATSLFVSSIIHDKQNDLFNKKFFKKILLIISLPSILILIQPDPGSVLTFISFVMVFYREGLRIKKIIDFCLFLLFILLSTTIKSIFVLIASIFYLILKKENIIKIILINIYGFFIPKIILNKILKQHHKDRIMILFKNEFDKKYRNNIGYNLLSSKTAIASGEFLGKGFKKGMMTKGKFIPEQLTDYIFCTIGEEWGFLGCSFLIIIFLFFIGRIFFISEKIKNKFGKILGYSTASIILIHLAVNISMVTGIIPTIGIPLPFFSYGGSSLWSFSILLSIFIRIYASEKN